MMGEQEEILELYRDDILLAVLSNIRLYDWPWYICHFHPTSAFEAYKPLFDQELELLEGQGATEEWVEAYEKIDNLGLTLKYPSQEKLTELFVMHIDGKTARFKAVFE